MTRRAAHRRLGDPARLQSGRGGSSPLYLCVYVCLYMFAAATYSFFPGSGGDGSRRWCAVVGGGPCAPPSLCVWRAGVVVWWHGGSGMVARRRVCGGGVRWGPRRPLHFFYFKIHLRRELIWPLGAHSPRGVPTALGEGCFAGCKPPRGNRREQTLGEGATVGKPSFTERIVALGEASVSGSDF
jgi:hypothetical protein